MAPYIRVRRTKLIERKFDLIRLQATPIYRAGCLWTSYRKRIVKWSPENTTDVDCIDSALALTGTVDGVVAKRACILR